MIGSEEMEKRPENCVQRMDLVGSNGAQSKALRERTNERTNPNDSPYSFANLYLFLFKSASLLYALSEVTISSVSISVSLVHPICFRILHPQHNAPTKANQCCFGGKMKGPPPPPLAEEVEGIMQRGAVKTQTESCKL